MKNKKAQGLSITTIVIVILAVVVLVALIMGFTRGWSNIGSWFGGGDNVQQIVSQCAAACATQSEYDFCTKTRTLKVSGEDDMVQSCDTFSGDTYSTYGIEKCPGITCQEAELSTEEKCTAITEVTAAKCTAVDATNCIVDPEDSSKCKWTGD